MPSLSSRGLSHSTIASEGPLQHRIGYSDQTSKARILLEFYRDLAHPAAFVFSERFAPLKRTQNQPYMPYVTAFMQEEPVREQVIPSQHTFTDLVRAETGYT